MEYTQRVKANTSDQVGYIPRFSARMLRLGQLPNWFFLAFLRVLVILPRALSDWVGSMLGDLYRLLGRKRWAVVDTNLRLCFPELSAQQRQALGRRHFRLYGKTLIDMALVWWASERFLDRYVRFSGLEHYHAQRELGRPVILLTGHFVGIDIGGPLISRQFKQIGLIKPVYNEVIDWVLGRGRIRFGSRMLLRDRGMRQVVQSIKEGYGFSYVPDEDFGPERSVFVPFLGTQAPTITSVSKLARMTNAAVLPCFVWRHSASEGYEIEIQPALDNFPSGDDVADAARVRKTLADAVAQKPEQYMWTFKFFSTQPDGGPSPYEA